MNKTSVIPSTKKKNSVIPAFFFVVFFL